MLGATLIKQDSYQLPNNYGTRNLLIFQKNKLKGIENETSIHHQELKLVIQRQIKYLEKQINN